MWYSNKKNHFFITPLTSFTDELLPSVTTIKSVGENHTDRITDGTRPSVKQSSVNPISVANSVANKKNHPPTETPTEIQTDTRAPKKSFPREHYRRNKSVGNFKGNYRRHYRRKIRR
jgi:hypothetical protein